MRSLFPVKLDDWFLNCVFETYTCELPSAEIETEFAGISVTGADPPQNYGEFVYKVIENILTSDGKCLSIYLKSCF